MRSKWYLVVVVCVVASLVMTACGAKSATPTSQVIKETQIVKETQVVTVKETQVVTQVVEQVVTPTPAGKPKGGYITFLLTGSIPMINPILRNSVITGLMFGASIYDDPQTGAPVGDMVEKWEVSSDGLRYTMHVRPGIQWTDGEPVTAKDYAFTWQALKSGKLESEYTEDAKFIDQINLKDDMTVEFVMSKADCTALNKIRLGWLPAHKYKADFSDVMENPLNMAPTVTNGPFMFKEWVQDDHITLVSNPNYWKGAPLIDGIIFKFVPNEAVAIQQLKTGEGDMMDIPPAYLAEMALEDNIVKYRYMVDGYDFIAFQMGDPKNPQPGLNADGTVNDKAGNHPVFGDKNVRQAVAYAIDRDTMISKLNYGLGKLQNADVLPAIGWAYNDKLQTRSQDIEKAKALLDEAGWKMPADGKVRTCQGCKYAQEGTPLEVTAIFAAGNEIRENIGVYLQSALADIGMKLNLEQVERASEFKRIMQQDWDMVIRGWRGMGPDPSDEFLYDPANDTPGGGFNFVSAYFPELTKTQMDARFFPGCALDGRGALYKQAQEIVYDETPYIYLWEAENILGVNRRIKGIAPANWGYWYNVEQWYIEP